MKKVLILEDQEKTRNALAGIVKRVDSQAVLFLTASADEAYSISLNHTIDLFLVDIILKAGDAYRDSSGADFAQNIRMIDRYHFTPIIFITSLYDEKLNMYSHIRCYKFIEKPCDYDEVEKVIRGAITFHTENGMDRQYFYRNNGILEALTIRDLIYVKSVNHDLYAVMVKENRTIPYKSLKLIQKDLDSEKFLQCNRSTIVNTQFIRMIDLANRYIYLEQCDDVIELGPVIKKTFLENLRKLQSRPVKIVKRGKKGTE